MFHKKNLAINCDLCDTRKMKEEDYSSFERILINADLVVVNENSKSILNRLPVMINNDAMVEIPSDMEIDVKAVNGSYEISGNTMVKEHTLLTVNGSLYIYPGTEAVLEKYEFISVNGSVKCPQSLESYFGKVSVNGSVTTYPDDCMILDKTFTIDKYFPLRARVGSRYYVENMVVVKDTSVDLSKLVQKNVEFVTKRLLVPECMVENCMPLFDERVDFQVVPDGMALILGNTVLDEKLIEKEGRKLFVYGTAQLPEECDVEALGKMLEKLIVKGKIVVRRSQEELFRKWNAEYDKLEISWEGRTMENNVSVRVDNCLLESSPYGVRIMNTAMVTIAEEVSLELILNRLSIRNCAKVFCKEVQESAVASVSENVALIGEPKDKDSEGGLGSFKDLLATKVVNADSYVM